MFRILRKFFGGSLDLESLLLGWGFTYLHGEHGYRSYEGLGTHVVTFEGDLGWELWADHDLLFDKCRNAALHLQQWELPEYPPEEFAKRLKSSLTLLGSDVGYSVSNRVGYLTNNPFLLESQNES